MNTYLLNQIESLIVYSPHFPYRIFLDVNVKLSHRNVGIPCERMWKARVMVKYVIRTDLGTYAHLESKSCAKMIEHAPAGGWNPTTPQRKKEPLSGPARGWKPTTPQWKNDPHYGGQTHTHLSYNCYCYFCYF